MSKSSKNNLDSSTLFNKLVKDFPGIWVKHIQEYVLETPKGWNDIVYKCSAKLENLLLENKHLLNNEGFYVSQVKSKFGSLRFYLSNYPKIIKKDIDDIIFCAEYEAEIACIICGNFGTTRTGYPADVNYQRFSFHQVLCEKCWHTLSLERCYNHIDINCRKWFVETIVCDSFKE